MSNEKFPDEFNLLGLKVDNDPDDYQNNGS